jgi:hypothetical protein
MDMVWMNAHRAENVGIGVRYRADLAEPLNPGGYRDHPTDPCGAGAIHNGVALGGEIRKIEMAMRVDQHENAR